MGQMSWLSHLIETEDEDGLIKFLAGKGFRNPKYAADEFLKAKHEIEEDEMKKAEEEYHKEEADWALTTADEYNNEWLDKQNKKSLDNDTK